MSTILETAKSTRTVRAVAAPTSSYVAGTIISMDTQNFLGIEVQYTKGDETSLEVMVESSINGGTTYFQQSVETPDSTGKIAMTPGYRQFTATGNYSIVIFPIKADLVKVSVKATGGTPTGTVGITSITSWA